MVISFMDRSCANSHWLMLHDGTDDFANSFDTLYHEFQNRSQGFMEMIYTALFQLIIKMERLRTMQTNPEQADLCKYLANIGHAPSQHYCNNLNTINILSTILYLHTQ